MDEENLDCMTHLSLSLSSLELSNAIVVCSVVLNLLLLLSFLSLLCHPHMPPCAHLHVCKEKGTE